VLMTADRGLAGAFNTNLIKGAQQFQADRPDAELEMYLYGRKGRDFFRKREAKVAGELIGVSQAASQNNARILAELLMNKYASGEVDAVYIIYNEFKSVLSQKLKEERILPLRMPENAATGEYIFEQPPEQLLGSLLPKHFEAEVYRAMLETAAAEHAARMTAMDAATSNAAEIIDKLTLFMNRVRQASITREIIEVVSGANALE
jgi:F-type H+-transporting ATPase subunit gamma